MGNYLVLVENDESAWNDQTGIAYHFPKKYLKLIQPGTEFIYYKGRMTNSSFKNQRLSTAPHYFGKGTIGVVIQDKDNERNYFAEIEDYYQFLAHVEFKKDGKYLEVGGINRSNYFRDGVRKITRSIYDQILSLAQVDSVEEAVVNYNPEYSDFESREEGHKKGYYTSYYERNPINRQKAIEFHGIRCQVCNIKFEEVYGELGSGYIHVHHVKPISSQSKSHRPDIKNDFAVLCPNCHAMIHRPKDRTLSIDELRKIFDETKSH